jgi:hypothetical protein
MEKQSSATQSKIKHVSKVEMITEKEKKIIVKNIKEALKSIGFYPIARFFFGWLLKNQDSQTFTDFAEFLLYETNWYLKGYREDGRPWSKLLIPYENIFQFMELWVNEVDQEKFLNDWQNRYKNL